MGQTIRNIASRQVDGKGVFPNRFVVEICEKIHVHYRSLRIIMSLKDWVEMAQGMADSLSRWKARGCPEPTEGTHIELCRKDVAQFPISDTDIKVNLNKNLYPLHEGRVFAEGAEIKDPIYIHLKIRDLRLELSLEEFAELSDAILEAKAAIKGGVDVGA